MALQQHSALHVLRIFSFLLLIQGFCAFTIPYRTVLMRQSRRTAATTTSCLSATGTTTIASLTREQGIDDRFGRWRYLQRFLDEEEPYPVLMVTLVLQRALQEHDPYEEGALTPERIAIIQELFPETDSVMDVETFRGKSKQLEELLPEEDENEDAFKSLWDTIRELHGNEAVKMDLKETAWRERCIVARVLLHYDFLARGLEQ